MDNDDNNCVLLLDKMQLSMLVEYDPGVIRTIGYVSDEFAERPSQPAKKAFVFMIKGLRSPHKQIVAWYLTSNSVKSNNLWDVTKTVKKYRENGIFVLVVNSDMGPANVGVC